MKRMCALFAVIWTSTIVAQEVKPEPASAGPGHKFLKQFVGDWECETDFNAEPGKPPQTSKGTRLYMQNHGGWPDRPGIGVLRSDEHGHTWNSIAQGLPSDFGFPIVVHPHDPDTVYVVPLEPMTRTCPGGAPAVWRSENDGASWKRIARGLPKKKSFFTVLRDGMDIDDLKTPALYFGTTTGQLGSAATAEMNGTACSRPCHPSTA